MNFLYNGNELNLSDENTTNKYSLDRYEADDGGVVFTLTVTNMTKEDSGVYTCVNAEHHDHILQETSVSILGEGGNVTSLVGRDWYGNVINEIMIAATLEGI